MKKNVMTNRFKRNGTFTVAATVALVVPIGTALMQTPPALAQELATTQDLAANQPQSVSKATNKPDATTKVETRQTVEERKSSESRLAKGEINFDDLKFDLEKDAAMDASMITKTIKKIDGRKVKLSGYILPASVYSNTNIKQFVLVRDNQECCFGPGAALFDCVMVEMEPDQTADFATRPVTVEGKFELDLKKYAYPGGKGPRGASHYAIFRIKGLKVK